MEGSILLTLKEALGLDRESEVFDVEIKMHLNAALMELGQIGAEPPGGLSVSDNSQTWETFFDGYADINAVQSYILNHLRLTFDPPTASYLVNLIQSQQEKILWRIANAVFSRTIQVTPQESSGFDSGFDSGFGG